MKRPSGISNKFSLAALALETGVMGAGLATVNGAPGQSLTVDMDDCATMPDMFSITAGSYSNSGPLIGGNIQIH